MLKNVIKCYTVLFLRLFDDTVIDFNPKFFS